MIKVSVIGMGRIFFSENRCRRILRYRERLPYHGGIQTSFYSLIFADPPPDREILANQWQLDLNWMPAFVNQVAKGIIYINMLSTSGGSHEATKDINGQFVMMAPNGPSTSHMVD
jgi:hypothetical protein